MNAKKTSILIVILILSTLITPHSSLSETLTAQHAAEKGGDISAQQHPLRTILVGTTDFLTRINDRPPVTNWSYFEELDQTTAHHVNLALRHLPSVSGIVTCHKSSGDGWWAVSCYGNGCLVTIKGSKDGDFGSGITCGLD